MVPARKGVRNIKTMAGLVERRRTRTAAGALLELSTLANERERLNQELAVAARRRKDIDARLMEIAEKQQRLQAFVKNPTMVAARARSNASEPLTSVKTKELRY